MVQILPKMETGYSVAVDGYLVPGIRVSKTDSANEDGLWNVMLENSSLCILADSGEMNKWIWLLANAQAIRDGYTCHGAHAKLRPGPHQVNVSALAAFGPNLAPTPQARQQDTPAG